MGFDVLGLWRRRNSLVVVVLASEPFGHRRRLVGEGEKEGFFGWRGRGKVEVRSLDLNSYSVWSQD